MGKEAEKSQAAQPTGPGRARRMVRLVIMGVLLLTALVAAAPYAAQYEPVRGWALTRLFADIDGTASARRASFGWFSPPAIHDLEIRDSSGRPVVVLPSVEGDTALWDLLWRPNDWGRIKLQRPEVRLAIDDEGVNLAHVFRKRQDDDGDDEPSGRRLRGRSASVVVEEGKLLVRGPESRRDWEIGDVNFALSLRPGEADDGDSPVVHIEQGVLLDRVTLQPGMCDDLLKYIAPVLAGVPTARGEFSIELNDCQAPLANLRASDVSGRLTVHSAHVGPGPLVRELALLLNVPPEIQLSENSVVTFETRAGGVHHEGLEFGLPSYRLRTSGWVGFDESLELIAEAPLPISSEVGEGRPLLRALSQQMIRIPIGGTLRKPKIDVQRLGQTNLASILSSVNRAISADDPALGVGDEDVVRELVGQLGRLLEPRDPAAAGEPGALTDPGQIDLEQILESLPLGDGQLLDRLRQRRAPGAAPSDPPAPPGASGVYDEFDRPPPPEASLRRPLLNALRQRLGQPPLGIDEEGRDR